MDKEQKWGFKDQPSTQEEFNALVESYMDRGEEEALFALLEKCPGFMQEYAGELEKELGL